MEKLPKIAITQSQVVYTAFTHVFLHRWSYIAWTVPRLLIFSFHLMSLCFLPALIGHSAFDSPEHALFLPACLGGLGIISTFLLFLSSSRVAALLVNHLLMKSTSCSLDQCLKANVQLDLWVSCCSDLSAQADLLSDQLSQQMHCVFEAASEQGALCWLSTLPIAEHGLALCKGEFVMLCV